MSDWIPCSERLPDIGVVVETKIVQGVITYGDGALMERGDGFWSLNSIGREPLIAPTHWRPIQ